MLEINTYIHVHHLHIALNTKSVRKIRQYLFSSAQDHILFHRAHLQALALACGCLTTTLGTAPIISYLLIKMQIYYLCCPFELSYIF